LAKGTLSLLLHIDDSIDDRVLVREALVLSRTSFEYHEANGIESAIAFFQFHNGKPGRPPALVLLDYDLGDFTGVDFLYWLRFLKKQTSVPVVMFSGSQGERHVAECYGAGANYFISKVGDLERLKLIVRTLHLSLMTLKQPDLILLLKEYQPDPRNNARSAIRA
jgi:DNA-binding response OmpR family regulator